MWHTRWLLHGRCDDYKTTPSLGKTVVGRSRLGISLLLAGTFSVAQKTTEAMAQPLFQIAGRHGHERESEPCHFFGV